MVFALSALLLIELVLQFTGNRRYFSWGIRIFNRRIAAPADWRERLSLGSLEYDVPRGKYLHLVFRPLPDGSYAFRESFAQRFYSLMRGRVVVDPGRREVRVEGRCSWWALCISLLIFPLMVVRPAAAAMLLMLPFFLVCYLVQKKMFGAVATVIEQQLRGVPSADAILRERLQARRMPQA